MSEVTNELMYEVLKALRDDVARVQGGQQDIRTELQAIRGHMLAMQTDIGNVYTILARHELRLVASNAGLISSMRP
jgi:hypothetical protein